MAYLLIAILLLSCELARSFAPGIGAAFINRQHRDISRQRHEAPTYTRGTDSSLSLVPDHSVLESAGNLIISTIDSDIANIPDNEFATVFAGGILVMVGGLLSTIFVGLVVDKKDLYANIVADSYVQGAEDEEFWKGLSDEEKIKAEELLRKIKDSKEGKSGDKALPTTSVEVSGNEAIVKEPVEAAKVTTGGEKKAEVGMFSDYADDN